LLRAPREAQPVLGKPRITAHEQAIDERPATEACQPAKANGRPHGAEHVHSLNHPAIAPSSVDDRAQLLAGQPALSLAKGRRREVDKSESPSTVEPAHEADFQPTNRARAIIIDGERVWSCICAVGRCGPGPCRRLTPVEAQNHWHLSLVGVDTCVLLDR